MSDILYRPNLDYEKNYHTEGSFQNDTKVDTSQQSVSTITGLDKIKQKLQRIETLLPSLPSDIAKALTPIIKGAKEIYNQIDPNNYDDNYINSGSSVVITASDNSTPTSTPSSTLDDDDGPDGIFSDLIPLIDVKVNKKNPIDAINAEYDNTAASILEDYLNNLQSCINKYYTKINVSANESGVTNLKSVVSKYEKKTTELKNKNLYHIADLVVRTQIVRDQKLRLFKKLFSLAETMSSIRACKVAKDLRIRYYQEKKVPNNDFLDLTKNIMLSDSKQIYDKKYEENLCNLYKYLNSSVILIDECLMMFIQEAQAKMILMKEEGIKL